MHPENKSSCQWFTTAWWKGMVAIFWYTSFHLITFNSLWPSDAIWWQGSRSTLVQVMACCLMAPSHHMNQCWLIISKVEWHSSKGKFTKDTSAINHWNYLENYVPKISFQFLRGHWVNATISPFIMAAVKDCYTSRQTQFLVHRLYPMKWAGACFNTSVFPSMGISL